MPTLSPDSGYSNAALVDTYCLVELSFWENFCLPHRDLWSDLSLSIGWRRGSLVKAKDSPSLRALPILSQSALEHGLGMGYIPICPK